MATIGWMEREREKESYFLMDSLHTNVHVQTRSTRLYLHVTPYAPFLILPMHQHSPKSSRIALNSLY
jgi:hypothetical protein